MNVNDTWNDEEWNGSDANCIEKVKVHCTCEPAYVAMKVETMLEEVDEKEKKGKTIETYISIGFYDNWIEFDGGGRGP